jgi:polyphosphate kinase
MELVEKEIIPSVKSYIHRDISWLSFNYRVLQEAKDPRVPLYEKLKFLAIYSSNLGEFFRVRIASHKNVLKAGKKARKSLEYDPEEVIIKCLEIVNEQQEEFSNIFESIIVPELANNDVNLLSRKVLNQEQKLFILDFFNNELLPYVQPVLLIKGKIKPFLTNSALYLALQLEDKETKDVNYAIVNIPSNHVGRFINLPTTHSKKHDIIMLDDIVRDCCKLLFPGYDIIDSFSVKLTRDAEIYIDDEYSGNLISKIKKGIGKRDVGPPSRLVYDRTMPKEFLNFLQDAFELNDIDLLPEGRYHNNFDFFSFPINGLEHLKDVDLVPHDYEPLEQSADIFSEIAKGDHLLYYPYHGYKSVVKFFEHASLDPQVTHIKIIQYRVASTSKIMDALMKAVRNGKRVSAFIEAKARFDEEANLSWGEKLKNAGVTVHYSFPGLKVHSKLALVRRVENGEAKIYAYMSTGNFHEKTAKLYTDFGFFTADNRITHEALKVFLFIEQKNLAPFKFQHLGVGKYNLKPLLKELVRNEIVAAKQNKKAKIFLKMNSLQDEEMVDLLYEAGQAGVKIKLIIRGICCLIPGVKGLSENIEGISIIDRYLEHARVFIFHANGEEKIYLSSADWMNRNLHRRIETMFPIYNSDHKKLIKQIMDNQWKDNVKARSLAQGEVNKYRSNDYDLSIRSQTEIYYYIKRVMERSKDKG